MPVADSVADSKQTCSTNRQPLAIQIQNRQYKFTESATSYRLRFRFETDNMSSTNRQMTTSCRLPIQLPIRNRHVQRIGNRCRFRFETGNISSTNRQLATSCRLPIQLPIRNRQVQRIVNWQLVAGCRFRFETDNRSSTIADSVAVSKQTISTNRQPATSCRFSCRFETDTFNDRQLATSCRLPIQIQNRQYKFNKSATSN